MKGRVMSMEKSVLRDIERFAAENSENIFRDIAALVAVNSVEGESAPGAPFGAGPRAVLDRALAIAARLGLDGVDCEGMIGYAALGAGDRYIATITHLDVVPTGDGWSHDPFRMIEREGYIIGRGVMDDKGPSVLCLYALKYLKDRGIALRYPVRALLGVNEETGMRDLKYYLAKYPAPVFCFSPDANFPLCNGEKGTFSGRILSTQPLENIVDIKGGFATNAVPDKAEAWVRSRPLKGADGVEVSCCGDGLWHLTAQGTGGHASLPEGTVNAIGVLARYILANGIAGAAEERFLGFIARILSDTTGACLGLASEDEYFKPLTIVGGTIGVEDGHIYQTVDSRYPTSMDAQRIAAALKAQAGEDATVTVESFMPPFYVPADSPEVQACLKAYRAVTGDMAPPYTIGGATYARHFPNAVSFGPEHPELPAPPWAGPIHGVDEAASKEGFLQALKVYILALLELEKLEY